MEAETVGLLGGLLFLLLAIVGGGFTIREIIMPRVPHWARVVCLVVGVALVVPFFASALDSEPSGSTPTPVPSQPSPSMPPGEVEIYSDLADYASDDGIQVSGLFATGEHQHPVVNDRITIQFRLKNVGTNPVTFDETFIAARDPHGDNEDFGAEHEGDVLAPGDVVEINHSIVVDTPGTWEFFPCYILQGDNYCPDEWRSFEVAVE